MKKNHENNDEDDQYNNYWFEDDYSAQGGLPAVRHKAPPSHLPLLPVPGGALDTLALD